MTYNCEYCNKEYTSISSLNHHKKTAKFCLELQKNINIESINIHIYNCEYCNKEFTVKNHLQNHLLTCVDKKIKDKEDIYKQQINELKCKENKYEEELDKLNKQYSKLQFDYKNKEEKNKQQIDELTKINSELTFEVKYKDEKLKDKDEQIKKLEELLKEKDIIIKEKDTIICKNNEKLTNELINRPQQVVNNSNNNNYTLQFNKLKDNLIPFTDDNIKNCIRNINGNSLIYYNDYNVMTNFISNFVNAIKVLAFCTDVSRGCLIIKDTDGNHSKIMANQFILKCFEKSRNECILMLDQAVRYLDNECEEENIDDVSYAKCISILTNIKGHILQGVESDLTKNISTVLSKQIEQLAKNSLK